MDPPCSGFFLDPSKCRKISAEAKRNLILELSKKPEVALQKLHDWSRRDILEILCADLGRERKYTGLSKQRIMEYLFKVVSEKSSTQKRPEDYNSLALGLPSSKRPRKSENPSRLPVDSNDGASMLSSSRSCANIACRATLKLTDTFCRRCSCCICLKFDDNKDPSLWLFCSSGTCGLSCHIECALTDERTALLATGPRKQLDSAYYCVGCGKENDLLGSWRKQLTIAKDARRVDVLCHRLFLSHRMLQSTEKHRALHETVDRALKKLEAEIGPISRAPNMGRGIVNRLAAGADAQNLCAHGILLLDSLLSGTRTLHPTHLSGMVLSRFVKFEHTSPTSLVIVLDVEDHHVISPDLFSLKIWQREAAAGSSDYLTEPVGQIDMPNKRLEVLRLTPAMAYTFKITAFCADGKELWSWEAGTTTKSDDEKAEGSPKANSSGLSNHSSEEYESNRHNNAIYADLNKSPESDSGCCDIPEIVDSEKDSQNSEKPSSGSEPAASIMEEESNLTARLVEEPANSTELNRAGSDVLRSEKASNSPAGDDVMIVPHKHFLSTLLPVTPSQAEKTLEVTGRISKTKPGNSAAIIENAPPGSSSTERAGPRQEEDYEHCVKVIRRLECDGLVETNFRLKFLTWYSLRATLHERQIVSVYINTLSDDPVSLAAQLKDTFSETIYSKRPPPVPRGFCMELWH